MNAGGSMQHECGMLARRTTGLRKGATRGHYLAGVFRRTPLKKPTKRSWRVIIMRSKGGHIGTVEAPDREAAEAVAIKQFELDQDQRRRLLIRERL